MTTALSASAENATISPDATIYGWNGYASTAAEDQYDMGWYRFGSNGEEIQLWEDNFLAHYGTYFNVGYIRNGLICGYHGNASAATYLEFDMEKGGDPVTINYMDDPVGEKSINNLWSGAYNAADDCVYGFATSEDGSRLYLVKANAADPTNISIVNEVPTERFTIMTSCCFSPVDNCMYGIDPYGDLVRCDVYGNFELLGLCKDMDYSTNLPALGGWESGMTYSPKDNAFIWNRQFRDYTSHLVKIDANTFKWSKIADIEIFHQYTILDTTDHDGDDNGPACGECTSTDFEGAATFGSVTYKMPTKLSNGEDAPASMTWTATCGDLTETGTAAPGATVTIKYDELPEGVNLLNFRADAGDAKGRNLVTRHWVGNDTPARPENVTLTPVSEGKYKLTWTAPTHGTHYGYMDASKLMYGIFLDGKQVGSATSALEAEVELPTDETTRSYYFMVVAVANNLQSDAAYSNTVYTGRGYSLPYNVTPTKEQVAQMYIINVDEDKSRWNMIDEVGAATTFFTSRDYTNPGDDYLITAPLYLEPNKIYEISFETRYHSSQKTDEFIDIWLGSAPTVEGIREKQILEKTMIPEHEYTTVAYEFTSDAVAGPHYIGIHYIGEADQGGIYLRNMKIVDTGKTSGVQTIDRESAVKVWSGAGYVAVSARGDARAAVYTPDGRMAASGNVNGETRFDVAPGIYIVNVDGKSYKVRVK